ncbi:EAL domain-containing protein [Herbaspirillum sp. RTI4]|uniref:EAL domain-containing protein n=1 Tax=Herbaspirillum sp. RTI4 TaxID=3048640 RepID=UPI002AB3B645|nr:EAL domain-containing protein [Herbaspirillum sp. RTI4]MDY7579690.1 EAL domain-containing protein [Herbaspirillum sp. RTI4]MEA9983017.1 EAL domain-containing protein [Herbaspirillum sp. RTI4]
MPFPFLEKYLDRLNAQQRPDARVWLDAEGKAQGKYFSTTLTSAFQAVRTPGGVMTGYEGFARSYAENDSGLSLWKLLDHAASDAESIELDRLCRILHTINFYRQPAATGLNLHLNVHSRLLAAVDSNHGIAFRRILSLLDLPHEKIILQLPGSTSQQQPRGWLLNYVLDNYRGNGFQVAIGARDVSEATSLLDHVRPDLIKIDGRQLNDEAGLDALLRKASQQSVGIAFKRVEDDKVARLIEGLAAQHAVRVQVQGYLWDKPAPVLDGFAPDAVAAA